MRVSRQETAALDSRKGAMFSLSGTSITSYVPLKWKKTFPSFTELNIIFKHFFQSSTDQKGINKFKNPKIADIETLFDNPARIKSDNA